MRFPIFLICLLTNLILAQRFVTADLIDSGVSAANSTGSQGEQGQVFDVKAYGAKGDGVTDDTAAFASVVAAATSVQGIVKVPGGTYVATIEVARGGISIQGTGRDATIIKAPTKTAATRVVAVANSDGTIIKDLTINGNKSERSDKKPIGYALLLYQSNDCVVENVRVTNAEQIGIGLSASKRTQVSKCDVDSSGWQNITTLNNKTGGCEGTVISNCRSTNPGYDCVQITAVGAVTLENCDLSGSPFGGVYVATGARNVTLRNNDIDRCYTGVDMSWGTAGAANPGPDKSEGNVISGNRISLCENIGIGTASNGTVISDNTVSDIGMRARTTYTLLGQRTAIASGGHGYSVGDVLTLVGGQYIKPAQVQVAAVGAGGSVTSITLPSRTTAYYLGVYTVPPSNPVSVKGGNGAGATFSTTWNGRALKYAGIAVVDAANVAITNNRSGNNPGHTGQRYGVALLRQFTAPSHLTMSGNTFSGNAVSSVSPLMQAGGRAP